MRASFFHILFDSIQFKKTKNEEVKKHEKRSEESKNNKKLISQ